VLAQLLHDAPPSLRVRAPRTPEALIKICERAMARDSAQRFPSADALAEPLEAYVAGIQSDSQVPIPARPRFVRMRPAVAYAVVAALALAGAASAFMLAPKWRSRDGGGQAVAVVPATIPAKGAECCSDSTRERCMRLDYDLSTGADDTATPPGPIAAGGADDWWVIADPNAPFATIIAPHPAGEISPAAGSLQTCSAAMGCTSTKPLCVRPGVTGSRARRDSGDAVTENRLNDHASRFRPRALISAGTQRTLPPADDDRRGSSRKELPSSTCRTWAGRRTGSRPVRACRAT
jgi:hypothetical protein